MNTVETTIKGLYKKNLGMKILIVIAIIAIFIVIVIGTIYGLKRIITFAKSMRKKSNGDDDDDDDDDDGDDDPIPSPHPTDSKINKKGKKMITDMKNVVNKLSKLNEKTKSAGEVTSHDKKELHALMIKLNKLGGAFNHFIKTNKKINAAFKKQYVNLFKKAHHIRDKINGLLQKAA
jgi:hypothetical protein